MRYPFEPLEQFVNAPNMVLFADCIGIDTRQVYRWRESGITVAQADALAVRAGALPYEIWPEMLDQAIADLERSCAAVGCEQTFVPLPNQRFCSASCRLRMKMRRYRSDPVNAERHRQERRRYYHEWESAEARRGRRERVG